MNGFDSSMRAMAMSLSVGLVVMVPKAGTSPVTKLGSRTTLVSATRRAGPEVPGERLSRSDARMGGILGRGAAAARSGSGRQAHLVHPLADRSEEHTSELQSLMRIPYAVF